MSKPTRRLTDRELCRAKYLAEQVIGIRRRARLNVIVVALARRRRRT